MNALARPKPRLGIIPEHNGIRGLGASIVVVGHVFVNWYFVLAPVLMDLFFIYSAFFVTRIFLNSDPSWRNVKVFYVRRAIRIWPLYYAVTIPCLVAEQVLSSAGVGLVPHHTLSDWLQFLSFFQFTPAYFVHYAGNPEYLLAHTWSLAIEEQFYITWPVLLILLIKRPRWTAPVLVGLALLSAIINRHGIASHLYLTRLDDFALGTASAWIAHRPQWRLSGSSIQTNRVLRAVGGGSLLVCLALSVAVMLAVPIDAPPGTVIGYDDNRMIAFVYKVFFAVMIPAVSASASHPIWGWLRTPVLVALGKGAYPLYLLHYPIVLVAFRLSNHLWGWDRATSGLISIPMTLLLTYLCYRVIELPAERKRQAYGYRQAAADNAAQTMPQHTGDKPS